MDVQEATQRWGLARLQERYKPRTDLTDWKRVTVEFKPFEYWTCGEDTCYNELPNRYEIAYTNTNNVVVAFDEVETGDLDLLTELLKIKD